MDSVRFAKGIENNLIALRRGIHRHPESGWTEYRTASVVMTELQRLGFDVKLGSDVILPEERMGLPGSTVDEHAQTMAIRYGAKADQVAAMEFSTARPRITCQRLCWSYRSYRSSSRWCF